MKNLFREVLWPLVAVLAAFVVGGIIILILGDNPLVLLTALQSAFEPDPSSSRYVVRDTPGISADGQYTDVPGARPMRVYTHLDCRLMIEDLFAKLREDRLIP